MEKTLLLCRKNLIYIPLAIIFIAVTIYVYLSDSTQGPILPCMFNIVTGLYSPGCGITRAFNALFHFEFYQALRYNALIYIISPMLAFYFVAKWRGKEYKSLVALMLFIAITYGVLRNTSMFSYLAPTVLGN